VPDEEARVVAELVGASKVFGKGELAVTALHPSDIALRRGELVLLEGPSGSGKTTVLSLLGCVLTPTGGTVRVLGRDVGPLSSRELASLRLASIGFVFQEFNLVEPLPAEENVAYPLLLAGVGRRERLRMAREALERLGLGDRLRNLPGPSPGGRSSGWPSPGPWSPIPPSSSATNPPRRWTTPRRSRSWTSSWGWPGTEGRWRWSPMTFASPPGRTGWFR
jgi:predicted ABC-type transport system involved in lysophospholipase L1 biosynthesis ATPase subunit